MRTTPGRQRGAWATYVTTARESLGLTKAELARRIGVDRGTVHRWEAGTHTPEDAQLIAEVARVLHVDVDDTLAAAGMRPGTPRPTEPRKQQPPLDPDVLVILRRLADPNVSRQEKIAIRAQLRYLAQLAEKDPPSSDEGLRAG